jgi:hypothetical protein
MSEHTKGKWSIFKSIKTDYPYYIVTRKKPYNFIADVCGEDMEPEETQANAKLIAAAPDLLASLVELVDIIDNGNLADIDSFTTQPAKAAITAAEGE